MRSCKARLLFQVLGCGPADYVSQAQGLQAAKRDLAKANKSLMDELAQLHGRELARQSKVQGVQIPLVRASYITGSDSTA